MSHPIVLGTAGHIDHGKTSLVRALTGIDTDRLPVEKARGITTELGFARLDLNGRRVAVVDVPGHERFVKSMVAGATGLDLVCLVIAADEGVMPQTREHLDICELLGVRRGLVVLTKRDMVDADWLELVTADVRTAVAKTFLATAPIVAVSAKTGEGMDELKLVLEKAISELPPRSATGVFRLPIDRVFTVKGFGTIVTGTVAGGTVSVGDELVVLPSGLSARVRGLEVHGAPVDKAVAGHRVALNLGGVAVDELARGDVLGHPGRVVASHILDVEIRHLATAPGPMPPRSKALVHLGTTQVLASIVLVGTSSLEPGGTALAQIRTDATTPLAALPGDHFILRGFTPTSTHGSTIAGGRVIRVLAPKVRDGSQHAAVVASLAAARQDQRIALDVKASAFAGLALADLVRRLGVPRETLAPSLQTLVATGELLVTGDAEHPHYFHATIVAELEQRINDGVTAGGSEGVLRESLRTQLPAALPARAYDVIVAGLEAKKVLLATDDRLRKQPKTAQLSATETTMLAKFEAWGVEPLRPKELAGALGIAESAAKLALDRLVAAKLVVRIKPDLMMHASVVTDLRTRLLAFLDQNKTIDAQQWKELTGASRKFTIPLAEYFDGEKVTLRVGDVRRKR